MCFWLLSAPYITELFVVERLLGGFYMIMLSPAPVFSRHQVRCKHFNR